ncbi:hypothetical protein Tco_0189977 [Tanacetum coccineum]
MEFSSSNFEERELQQMQLEEKQLHSKCVASFKELKSHLGNLHNFSEVENTRPFEIAFCIFFCEERQTFIEKMYHSLNQLQWQLERHNFHGHDSKTCFEVPRFKEFFDSKEVNASDFHNKCWQHDFKDYTRCEPETYKQREIQQQESLVTEGTTFEANLSIDGATLEASLVTEGIVLDASLVAKQSTVDSSTSSE